MDPWLDGPVTSVCYGWKIERSDGITLGFISHDRDVVHDGLLLRAAPGMVPTTISETAGLEPDGLEVRGGLTSDAISQDDLRAGRWDRSHVEIFLFDWSSPGSGRRLLANGELGAISFTAHGFEAEFLGLKSVLDRPVTPQTSPACRAQFCDADCGLNRHRFRHLATVSGVDGTRFSLTPFPAVGAGGFVYGQLRWMDGPNCGLAADIVASDVMSVTVPVAPATPAAIGHRVELVEGCDKQIETCATRFANGHNFRGEPYLPGNDLLTRYPGAS